MTTISTISTGHFEGGKNLTIGQRYKTDATLEELLEQAKVDIQALEAFQAGLKDPKDSVRLATAAALNACTAAGTGAGKTLTQNAAAIENIDGVAVALGDRILVKNQVAGKDNGIYTVTTVGTGAVKQVLTRAADFDEDDEVTAGAWCHAAEGTANADTKWVLTTNDPIVVDTTALVFAELAPVEHAAAHARGGADEIDGDHLDIDYTPGGYTPSTAPAEAANVDDLAAHLAGISDELVDAEHDEGSSASVLAIQAGQPVAAETLSVGADVYEADGAGANINFAIGADAEGTLDNLLAAAVASGTENLFWDKLSATQLRIRAADAPQGNIIGSDPSVVLDASGITNWSFNVGDVNMNTLAGQAAAARKRVTTTLAVTAAMITATAVRFSFPFTVTAFQIQYMTAAGVTRLTQNDTAAINGGDVLVTLAGGGAPDVQATDVIVVTAVG